MNIDYSKQLLSLKEVFQDKLFKVPSYQRSYSWGKKQREDLLKDIENLQANNSKYKHFTGTLVLSKREKQNEIFEIVDGQQRITTLIILLKVYFDRQKDSESSNYKLFIDRGANTRNLNYTLELNSKDMDSYFKEIVYQNSSSSNKLELVSQKNILDAKEEFNRWWDEREEQDIFFETIINKLGFLIYVPQNNEEIGIMFEVINNRGKRLTELEKVKNYLIYYSSKSNSNKISDLIDRKWEDIIKNLSKIEFYQAENSKTGGDDSTFSRIEDNFLKSCWIVFFEPQKKKSYNVYENLKIEFDVTKHSIEGIEKIISFVNFLIECSSYYYNFFIDERNTENKKFLDIIKELRYHTQHASIMPLYLTLINRSRRLGDSEQNEIFEVLELIEKLNFRIYGLNATKRADTEQGELFRLAYDLHNNFGEDVKYEQEIKEFTYNFLKEKLKQIIRNNCPDNKLRDYLLKTNEVDFDLYRWTSLKFFLYSYEKYLNPTKTIDFKRISSYSNSIKDKKHDDFYSVEHILPVHKEKIKHLDSEEGVKLSKRLGNFTLLELGLNSKTGNEFIEEKLRIYSEESHVKMTKNMKKDYEKTMELKNLINKPKTKNYYVNLYKGIIELREEAMLNFLKERWGI